MLIAVLAVGGACSGSGAERGLDPGGPIDPPTAERAILGLCEVGRTADPSAAEDVFHDRSHDALHGIAAAVEEVDRGVAAELLTAKQRVEADLASDRLPSAFPAHVDDLLDATRRALEALGVPAPPCPA